MEEKPWKELWKDDVALFWVHEDLANPSWILSMCHSYDTCWIESSIFPCEKFGSYLNSLFQAMKMEWMLQDDNGGNFVMAFNGNDVSQMICKVQKILAEADGGRKSCKYVFKEYDHDMIEDFLKSLFQMREMILNYDNHILCARKTITWLKDPNDALCGEKP